MSWQPMDSAPHDGTTILARSPRMYDELITVQWDLSETGGWLPVWGGRPVIDFVDEKGVVFMRVGELTEWHPLPKGE